MLQSIHSKVHGWFANTIMIVLAIAFALWVLSGNFTCLLWQKFFTELENKLKFPKTIAFPYMQQIFTNLQLETSALTGPLARGDQHTIAANLAALEGDPFQKIYRAFVAIHENGRNL